MGTKGSRFFACCILLLSISLQAAGFVRLVEGKNDFEGRVEIFHNGVWGTVCDDDWDEPDAEVVCHQLGFSGVKADGVLVKFGEGSGMIWLDNVKCSGMEADLRDCKFEGWGTHNCGHSEDVGVRCHRELVGPTLLEKYALHHSTSWSERLGVLFDSGTDGDFKINVVENGIIVDSIWAHRLILRQNPNVKDTLTPPSIRTTSKCSRHARAFIRYFYTGEISLNHTACICILKMASDWGLVEFQSETPNIIVSMLSQDYTFEGSLSVYEYALSPLDEVVMDILLHYLAWNFERLVQTPSWTNLPSGLVVDLLTRSDLVVSREIVVLQSLEKWATAQGMLAVPQELLQLIRFPMMPAEDLYLLSNPQYYARKCEGFKFHVVPYSSNWTKTNSSKPRIYTGSPWSYSISHYMMEDLRNQSSLSQGGVTKAFDFHTPFHNSALFTNSKANWKLSLNFKNDKSQNIHTVADLNFRLNLTMAGENTGDQHWRCVHFSNKLIIKCGAMSTVRIDDFVDKVGGEFVYKPSQAGVTFSCNFNLFSYKVVIRSECRPGPRIHG